MCRLLVDFWAGVRPVRQMATTIEFVAVEYAEEGEDRQEDVDSNRGGTAMRIQNGVIPTRLLLRAAMWWSSEWARWQSREVKRCGRSRF